MPRGRPRKEKTETPKTKAVTKNGKKDVLKHLWDLRLKQLGIK